MIDKKSFSEFARNLLKQYKTKGEVWENNRMDKFIEGISYYAEDIDGYYTNLKFEISPNTATWIIFAQILSGATKYE